MKRLALFPLVALVLAACQDSTQPEVDEKIAAKTFLTASLLPGQAAQFQTSTVAVMTLTVTNTSRQNLAWGQINCSSATPDTEDWSLSAYRSKNETKVWGGCLMEVINFTNPNNAATVSVSLYDES